MVKRIKQYEKFVENCERYKKFEKLKQQKELMVRRNSMVDGMNQDPVQRVIKRSRSLSPFPQDKKYKDAKKRDRYSLPEFLEADSLFTLDEKIICLQSCGGSFTQKGSIKATSLTDPVEEEEEETGSKSIDSYKTCTWV